MAWLIWVAGILGAFGIAWAVFRVTGVPHEQKFCPGCKQMSLWHPKRGCTVCHSTDSIF